MYIEIPTIYPFFNQSLKSIIVSNYVIIVNLFKLQVEKCRTWNTTEVETVYPTECPAPEETSTDCTSDCWSPGVDDVDCPTTGKISFRITDYYISSNRHIILVI